MNIPISKVQSCYIFYIITKSNKILTKVVKKILISDIFVKILDTFVNILNTFLYILTEKVGQDASILISDNALNF